MEGAVRKFACLLVATLLIGLGCGGSGGSGEGNLKTQQKPVADAGASQTVPVNSLVQLDGSRSASPSGRLLTYQWTLDPPPGSASKLNNGAVANPTFLPDAPGSYVLHLVVNDGVFSSDNSSVTITAVAGNINIPPVADAGTDQIVVLGIPVVFLDGSGSHDANGDPITYSWRTLSLPAGSNPALIKLSHTDQVNPDFTPDVTGNYTFGLTVTDNNAASSIEDNVTITVQAGNVPPVADAGPNRKVVTGATVTLDGGGSYDPNPGDLLTYSWSMISRPSGSIATLSNPLAAQTTFQADVSGSYVFSLVVTDNGSATSDPSTVTISADRLKSISVTPLDCVTTQGFSVQYSAFGTYEIASQEVNVTDDVTWTSDNTSVATIDPTGFARTWSKGVTIIRASSAGGPTSRTTLRVGPVILQSMEITNPSPVNLKNGQKVQLELRGHYSDGTSLDLTNLATWSQDFASKVGLWFDVNNTDQKGLVTAGIGIGSGEVMATYQGKDAKVTVNVTL